MVLSLCNYCTFLLEFTVMIKLVYLCMQYRSLPLKKFLWDQWTHVTIRHDVINTINVTQAVNHIPMVRNTITLQLGSIKNVYSVYIASKNLCKVHCNRIVWWTQFVTSKMPLQHTKFPLINFLGITREGWIHFKCC